MAQREFAGAVALSEERLEVPTGTPGIEEALRCTEQANTMSNDIGRRAMFRAVQRSGRIYIRAEINDGNVKTWSWEMFAKVLQEIQAMWVMWSKARKKGHVYEEPSGAHNVFNQSFDECIGLVEFNLADALDRPKCTRLSDVYHNVLGYVTVSAWRLGDPDDTTKVELTNVSPSVPAGAWGYLRAADPTASDDDSCYLRIRPPPADADRDELGLEDEPVAYVEGIDPSADMQIEVWINSAKRQRKEKRASAKHNPLMGNPHRRTERKGYSGGDSGAAKAAQDGAMRAQCVVCLRVGRKGEFRKSGFKCTPCIGIPSSSVKKHPKIGATPGMHMTLSMAEPDLPRHYMGPPLPGAG